MRRDPIVSGNISELIPIGLDGRPVYTNASSFLDALTFNNKSQNDFSRHLAIPQMSLDGVHMDWYVPFEPSADKGAHDIVSWYDVEQKQRDDAVNLFRRMESALTVTGRAMARQSSQSSMSTIARYLEKSSTRCLPALHFPGPDCIYFVDGVPVITFWGFTRNMKSLSQSPFDCLNGPEASQRPVVNDKPPVTFKAVADDRADNKKKPFGQDDSGDAEESGQQAGAERPSLIGKPVTGRGADSRSAAAGMSRAVLILAASIFLLTLVLLLKFLGVFDRADGAVSSAPAENQIYLDSGYTDSSASSMAQDSTGEKTSEASEPESRKTEAQDTAATAVYSDESADAAESGDSSEAESEVPAEQVGQENGIYLSDEYVDSH